MTREQAREKAYRLLAVTMPASWMEKYDRASGNSVMTPKAVKLRDFLAEELLNAYHAGLQRRVGKTS